MWPVLYGDQSKEKGYKMSLLWLTLMESEIVLLGIALAGLMTMGILKITSSAGRTRED